MGNQLITPIWTLKQVGRSLVNNLKFAANVDRSYDGQYVQGGAKVGWYVNARLPQRFMTTRGQALQLQAIQDNVVPVALTDQLNVAFGWSSAQATLEVQDVVKRYTNPAGSQLANTFDADGLSRCYGDVFWSVGSPGTAITTIQPFLDAGATLTDGGVEVDGRTLVISPKQMASIVGGTATQFNPQSTISGGLQSGLFARNWLGWEEWYQDQNVAVHTVGPLGGTPQVTGANQSGYILKTKLWTAAAGLRLKRGDQFTIPGVEAINPQSYNSVLSLQIFTATADVYSDGSGNADIPILPPIIASGAYQTVTAAPADNAPLTVIGAANTRSREGLGFTNDAFVGVTADLEMPKSGQAERIRSKELGLALRYWEDSIIQDDSHPSRIDILTGWRTVRPEKAIRLRGAA